MVSVAGRLNWFVLAIAAVVVFSGRVAGEEPKRRPNFVFILTDDQRWDIMGCVQREQGEKARFPWLKTPNLDRIAAEGVRFRNAFVVNSLCAPSRASFLTGCYGHVNGIVNNHTELSADRPTHSSLLRKAGYTTAYIGKWHMGRQLERPGFDFAASFLGQGVYFDCPFVVNGQTTPSKGWIDDVSTDYAVKFVRENKAKPFCMVVGYKAVHGPFTPPDRRKDDYAGEEARAVPNLGHTAIYRSGESAEKTEGEKKIHTNLGYMRCIAAMDDNVGRLLKELDDLGLAEDTVLVFAGDNGYYLGEHGLGDKRSAYEESLRIPLMVRYPRALARGKTIDALVLNIDLAPTFLDYAGVAVPKEMHGRSWRPLFEEKATDWRKAFFYCYFFERSFNTPTVTAVRTETAKLIKYPGHDEWTEMFDLQADPYELKNLYLDAAHAELRKTLEAEYEKQSASINFKIPGFADDPAKDEGGGKGGKMPGKKK